MNYRSRSMEKRIGMIDELLFETRPPGWFDLSSSPNVEMRGIAGRVLTFVSQYDSTAVP